MPNGWATYTLDADWRMIDVSDEMIAMLGWNPEGEVIWDMFPDGVGSEFWEAAHFARKTGLPRRNVSTYPVHGMTWESMTIPDGDLLRVILKRTDLADQVEETQKRLERLEAIMLEIRTLLVLLPVGGGGPGSRSPVLPVRRSVGSARPSSSVSRAA